MRPGQPDLQRRRHTAVFVDLLDALGFGAFVGVLEVQAAWVSVGRFDLPAAVAILVWDSLLFLGTWIVLAPLRIALERLLGIRIPALAVLLGVFLTLRVTTDSIFNVLVSIHPPSPTWAALRGLAIALPGSLVLIGIASLLLRHQNRYRIAAALGIAVLLQAEFWWSMLRSPSGLAQTAELVAVSVGATAAALWFGTRRRGELVAAAAAAALVLAAGARGIMGPAPLSRVIDHGVRDQRSAVSASASHPNLVLIVLDTVRADHLDLYGYKRKTMPHVTKFASKATVYTDCTSTASWTLPSHASLFTGLPPRVHGAHGAPADAPVPRAKGAPPLGHDHATLAGVLSEAGYQTSGIAGNVLWLKPKYGLNQGFSYWDARPAYRGALAEGYFPLLLRTRTLVDATPLRFLNDPFITLDVAQTIYPQATSVTDRAIERIHVMEKDGSAPFFLFLNYMDAHAPYQAPGRFADYFPGRDPGLPRYEQGLQRVKVPKERIRSHLAAMYDSELAYLDSEVGRLLAFLEKRGLDDTIVVITADHGEGLLDHGSWTHMHSLYQSEVHVPLIVYDPRSAPGVVTAPVSLQAVMPWLLYRLRVDAPEDVTPIRRIRDLKPIVAELYGTSHGRLTSIRDGPWKLIQSSEHSAELYDIAADPGETKPLQDRSEREVARLQASLDHWREGTAQASHKAVPLSRADKAQLQALGYAR